MAPENNAIKPRMHPFLVQLFIMGGTILTLAFAGVVFYMLVTSDNMLSGGMTGKTILGLDLDFRLVMLLAFAPFIVWIVILRKFLKRQKTTGIDLNKSKTLKWFHNILITLLILFLLLVLYAIYTLASAFP
jgi:hypothetical protein